LVAVIVIRSEMSRVKTCPILLSFDVAIVMVRISMGDPYIAI